VSILYIEGDAFAMKRSQGSDAGDIDENESSSLGPYKCEIRDRRYQTHLRNIADEEIVIFKELVM
jgi:hypothetical protein